MPFALGFRAGGTIGDIPSVYMVGLPHQGRDVKGDADALALIADELGGLAGRYRLDESPPPVPAGGAT